jgi:cytochrome b
MVEILATLATKIAFALAEAIILRLVWELWAAYSRSLRTAFIPASV